MGQEKPKAHTAEFRELAVKLASKSHKPIAQFSINIGLNENTLISGLANTTGLSKIL